MPNDLITEKLVLPWPYNQNAVESRILRHSSNPSSNPVCDGETLAGLVEFLHGAPRPLQALGQVGHRRVGALIVAIFLNRSVSKLRTYRHQGSPRAKRTTHFGSLSSSAI